MSNSHNTQSKQNIPVLPIPPQIIRTNQKNIDNSNQRNVDDTDSDDYSNSNDDHSSSSSNSHSDNDSHGTTDQLEEIPYLPRKAPLSYTKIFYILLIAITIGIVINNTVINNVTTSQIDIPQSFARPVPVRLINWWEIFTNRCCIVDTNCTNTLIKNRNCKFINNDCSANGNCRQYLSNWLGSQNQSLASPWVRRCCYDFRSLGALDYHTFCSFTCLNVLAV